MTVIALAIPVVGIIVLPPDVVSEYGALLLLPVTLPPFLLGFHRGYRGTIMALAACLLATSLALVLASALGTPLPYISPGLSIGYVGLIFGIAWLTEMLHREREEVESHGEI